MARMNSDSKKETKEPKMYKVKGLYTIPEISDKLYNNHRLSLPVREDLDKVLALFPDTNSGYIPLAFKEESWFLYVVNLRTRKIEIKSTAFRHYGLVLIKERK